jgi:hypothetical protein
MAKMNTKNIDAVITRVKDARGIDLRGCRFAMPERLIEARLIKLRPDNIRIYRKRS